MHEFLKGKEKLGAREVTQGLRAQTLLPGNKLCSKHPHGGLKHSLTPVSGGLTTPSGLLEHQACIWCTDIHACRTPIHAK